LYWKGYHGNQFFFFFFVIDLGFEGNYSLTLIDALDSLIIFGNVSRFEELVAWVVENISFQKDVNVSVFETNIRVLGGLLSAYMADPHSNHSQKVLQLAQDLAERLLVAFNTPMGMLFGSVGCCGVASTQCCPDQFIARSSTWRNHCHFSGMHR
jgi:hypothetical protein